MKRAIIKAPEGISLDKLTKEQQAAIIFVFAQFVLPMPGTIVFDNNIIIDSITGDNFDPEVMPGLDLPFELMGMWQWDGVSQDIVDEETKTITHALIELVPLNSEFINFLPEESELQLPHGFAGWPV